MSTTTHPTDRCADCAQALSDAEGIARCTGSVRATETITTTHPDRGAQHHVAVWTRADVPTPAYIAPRPHVEVVQGSVAWYVWLVGIDGSRLPTTVSRDGFATRDMARGWARSVSSTLGLDPSTVTYRTAPVLDALRAGQ